jgi:hypothetical protein
MRRINGPQFIAKDFKEFIRISGMTHSAPRHFTGTSSLTADTFVSAEQRKGRTLDPAAVPHLPTWSE